MQELAVKDGGSRSWADVVAEKKPYYQKRVDLFEQYAARERAAIEAAKAANVPITVVLPDGGVRAGVKGATTPLDVANDISKSLAKKTVVAKVDGEVWDLFRPLEGDCSLSLHSFEDPEGKEVRRWAATGVASGVRQLQHVPQQQLRRRRRQQPANLRSGSSSGRARGRMAAAGAAAACWMRCMQH